jgi:outer membrane receptor for monomeric catechols
MQNPTVEAQRSTTLAQPPLTSASSSCITSNDVLAPTQRSAFEKYGIPQVLTGQNITTIEQNVYNP